MPKIIQLVNLCSTSVALSGVTLTAWGKEVHSSQTTLMYDCVSYIGLIEFQLVYILVTLKVTN